MQKHQFLRCFDSWVKWTEKNVSSTQNDQINYQKVCVFMLFFQCSKDTVIYMCFVHCQKTCKNTILLYELPSNLSQKYVFLQHSKQHAKTPVFTMLRQLSEKNRKTRHFDTKRLDKWPEGTCFYDVLSMLRRCRNLHVFCALPEYM